MRAAVVLLAVGTAGTAAADGFAWQAPASCPAAGDVLARIEHRLDRETRVRDIEVTVQKARAGFTATIDARTARGAATTRTLNAASCRDLADAVAVIVARLATEAQQAALAAEPEIEIEPPASPEVVGFIAPPRRDHVVLHRDVPAPAPEWNGGIRALALSGIGMVPGVGYGGELAVNVQRKSRFAELGYARWADASTAGQSDAAGLDVGISLVVLRAGWASPRMPLRGWLGVEVGSMHASTHGLAMSERPRSRWVAPTAGFGVSWPMTPSIRLAGTFEIAVPITGTDYRFGNGDSIYQTDPLAARCALGLEVTWR